MYDDYDRIGLNMLGVFLTLLILPMVLLGGIMLIFPFVDHGMREFFGCMLIVIVIRFNNITT